MIRAVLALAFLLATAGAAFGQAGGPFLRADCTTLTSPVTHASVCFDTTGGTWRVWNGSIFAHITSTGLALENVLIGANQNNLVNYQWNGTPSGTTQQVTGAFTTTSYPTAAIPSSAFRIALYAGAETRAGGEAILPLNISAIARAADPVSTVNGLQMTLSNNQASSALNCVLPACYNGISVVSSGSGIASYAYNVSGTGQWRQGYEVDSGAIATGGFAFNYKGNGTNGNAVIRADSTIELGFTSSLGNPNEVHIGNNRFLQALNAAGSALIAIASVDTNNQPTLGATSNSAPTVVRVAPGAGTPAGLALPGFSTSE